MRKKGRPKKICRRPVSAPNKTHERMNVIRMQLEQLRLLCDMIKKREKVKVKKHEAIQELFCKKISLLSSDFPDLASAGGKFTSSLLFENQDDLDLDQSNPLLTQSARNTTA